MMKTLRLGWSRIGIELRQFSRDKDAAFWTFAFPFVLMVIFGSVFGSQKIGALDITFAQYFFAGMIGSGVLYTSFQNLAISIPQEREEGALKRLQAVPMPKAAYFIGKIGLVFFTYVGQTLVLFVIGIAMYGVKAPATVQAWWNFTWISLLGLISCTLLGLAFSSIPKSGKGASAVVSPIVLVLQFTSGVFFQYSQLPSWMQQFSALFPLKWLTQGMRGVFLPSEAGAIEQVGNFEVGKTALVLLVWTVLGALLAGTTFKWRRRGDR